jgi:hypothetical protein
MSDDDRPEEPSGERPQLAFIAAGGASAIGYNK